MQLLNYRFYDHDTDVAYVSAYVLCACVWHVLHGIFCGAVLFRSADLPSIVSEDRAMFIDPLMISQLAEDGGTYVQLSLTELANHCDQADSYTVPPFNCSPNSGNFDGTLFRFPLRSTASKLSSNLYTAKKAHRHLFKSARHEAPFLLLFLQHVEQLKIYERRGGQSEVCILNVKEENTAELRSCREQCVSAFRSLRRSLDDALYDARYPEDEEFFDASGDLEDDNSLSSVEDDPVSQQHTDHQGTGASLAAAMSPSDRPFRYTSRTSSIVIEEDSAPRRTHRWLVVHWLCESLDLFDYLRRRSLEDEDSVAGLKLSAAVAAPLALEMVLSADPSARLPWLMPNLGTAGRVFCYLPMDTQTGLPLHVHACFAVNVDRRGIAWPGDGDKSPDAEWNELLVRNGVTEAYVAAIQQLASRYRFHPPDPSYQSGVLGDNLCCTAYYLWPNLRQVGNEDGPWYFLMQNLIPRLLEFPLLWTHADGGRWVAIGDVWCMKGDETASCALTDGSKCSEEVMTTVYDALLAANIAVVLLPPHVWTALKRFDARRLESRRVTPQLLLQICHDVQPDALRQPNITIDMSMALLDYLTSDTALIEDQNALDGLPFLPVLGTVPVGKIQMKVFGESETYICSDEFPASLLPGLSSQVVASDRFIPSHLYHRLQKMASPNGMIRDVDVDLMLQLLPESIQTWSQVDWWSAEDGFLLWTPGHNGHPEESWIHCVWDWMAKQLPDDLSPADDLPILPDKLVCNTSVNKYLLHALPPSLPPPLVAREDSGHTVPEEVKDVLQCLGCEIVTLPLTINHPCLLTSCATASPAGVITALQAIWEEEESLKEITATLEAATEQERRCLLSYLSCSPPQAVTGDAKKVRLLRSLPIYKAAGAPHRAMVLRDDHRVIPANLQLDADLFGLPLPDCLLGPADEDLTRFLRSLGCGAVDLGQLFLEYLLQLSINDPRARHVIHNELIRLLPSTPLEYWGQGTLKKMSRLAFVPNRGNDLRAPATLYDPSNLIISNLIQDDNDFLPGGAFGEDKGLIVLRDYLGLQRFENLTTPQRLQLAETHAKLIKSQVDRSGGAPLEKALALIRFLQCTFQLDSSAYVQWKQMAQNVAWLPVMERPSSDSYPTNLPWQPRQPEVLCVQPSSAICCSSLKSPAASLLGSTAYVLHPEVESCLRSHPGLSEKLSIYQQPTPNAVIRHLLNVSQFLQNAGSTADQPLWTFCDTTAQHVYQFLCDECSHANVGVLHSEPWIWSTEGGFLRPDEVVARLPPQVHSLKPYFYTIEPHLQRFIPLFQQAGLLETVDMHQMKAVLDRISAGKKGKTPLTEEEMDVCLSLLKSKQLQELAQGVSGTVPVPTVEGVLLPAKDCTYCDRDFLRKVDADDEEDYFAEYNLVHGNLSDFLAKVYGAKPLSNRVLPSKELPTFQLDDDSKLLGAKASHYGEKLTTRIRHILREYQFDLTVLKELIQNADDAGASEVRFMLDYRSCPENCKKLLSDEMRHWQGPALWEYNNAPFTDKDFENITRLGDSKKRSTPGKIGRFGLGFCSVYHLTDVPSIVSGSCVRFLDPHCDNVKGRAVSSPGLTIDFVKHQTGMRRFSDQFNVYNDVFGCRLTDSRNEEAREYPSTLFRFPLRTGSKKSDVSKRVTEEAVDELLWKLRGVAADLLLFLQNVRSLHVYRLPENTSPKEAERLFVFTRMGPEQHIFGSPSCSSLLADVQREQGSELGHKMKGKLGQNPPQTGYAVCISSGEDECNLQEWLICSSFGSAKVWKEASKYEQDQRSDRTALVPWASVACRLSSSPKSTRACPVQGQAFCFLPVVDTGLPVHVNAFFSIHGDQKNLYFDTSGDDRSAVHVAWNRSLCRDALPRAYLALLHSFPRLVEHRLPKAPKQLYMPCSARSLFAVLPGANDLQDPLWGEFAKQVMNLVHDSNNRPSFLRTPLNKGVWVDLPKAKLLSDPLDRYCQKTAIHILLNYQHYAIESDPGDGLRKSLELISDKVETRFVTFEDICRKNLPRMLEEPPAPPDLIDGLLKPLFQYIEENPKDQAADVAAASNWWFKTGKMMKLIPTRTGGRQCCSRLVDPKSVIYPLFEEHGNRVPDDSYSPFLPLLRKSGVVHSAGELLSKDISKAMKSISSQAMAEGYSSVHTKVEALLTVMEERCKLDVAHGKKKQLNDLLTQMSVLPLFPVRQEPPENWPFSWFGTDCSMETAQQIFPFSEERALAAGSSIPFLDSSRLSLEKFSVLSERLSIQKTLPLRSVVKQLSEAVNYCHSETHPNVDKVKQCVDSAYKQMQEQLDNVEKIKEDLPQQWVWTEHAQRVNFVSPANIFLCAQEELSDLDLMPFLLVTPPSYKHLHDLLRRCGAKKCLHYEDLIDFLRNVKKCVRARPEGESQLTTTELEVVVKVVEKLYDKLRSPSFDFGNGACLLPTEAMILRPAAECTYFDYAWLREGASFQLSNTGADLQSSRVHKKVEWMAGAFGARPISREILPSEELPLVYKQVGPHEDLTTRLRNILDGYPCDVTIFKEMVQNADDAGAKEVAFVLDGRQHSKKSLLHENMAGWQGPALVVYNDAEFTTEDFENIMSLGGGTKKDDPGKIGKFGIGFSSVYNLTDVPSFVSGDHVVMVDPHTTNLGKTRVSSTKPGMEINFTHPRSNIEVFADQFAPYAGLFGCNLKARFPHTLFRLPLRRSADTGRISSQVRSISDLCQLASDFWDKLSEIMLFLKFVCTISFYKVVEGGIDEPTLHTLFQVSLEEDSNISLQRRQLQLLHKDHGDRLIQHLHQLAVDGKPLPSASVRLLMKLSLTANGSECLPDLHGECERLEEWLVCSSAGYGKAVTLAFTEKQKRKHGHVPWASCALKLARNRSKGVHAASLHGQAFCFLPLPINTPFPVHINAGFATTPDRRSLENTNDGNFNTEWNRSLLSDVVARSYLHLLESFKCRVIEEDQNDHHTLAGDIAALFPEPTPPFVASGPLWQWLSYGFKDHLLKDDSVKLLWTGDSSHAQWQTAARDDICFLHPKSFGDGSQTYTSAVQLQQSLGSMVAPLPDVYRSIVDHLPAKRIMSLRQFFEGFFQNLQSINREKVVSFLHVLFSHVQSEAAGDNGWWLNQVRKSKCIPVRSGDLAKPASVVHPDSRWKHLFSEEHVLDQETAHFSAKEQGLLEELGMIKEGDLPDKAIRICVKILTTTKFDERVQRTKTLLRLLSDRLDKEKEDSKSSDGSQSQKFIRDLGLCLPVASHKPKDYVLPWHGESKELWVEPHLAYPHWNYLQTGSCSFVIDTDAIGLRPYQGKLLKALNVPKTVPAHVLVEQLNEAIKFSSQPPSAKDQNEAMNKITKKVYKELEQCLVADQDSPKQKPTSPTSPKGTALLAVKSLIGKRWIWIDGQFVTAAATAFNYPQVFSKQHFPPHFFCLSQGRPLDEICPRLLLQCGVREEFDRSYYFQVMEKLRQKYEGEQASDSDCDLLVKLAELVSKLVPDSREMLQNTVLPSAGRRLHHASEVCYVDIPWLKKGHLRSINAPVVHKSVSASLAEALSLTLASDYLVDTAQLGMSFGQNENLEDRIVGLLKKYQDVNHRTTSV